MPSAKKTDLSFTLHPRSFYAVISTLPALTATAAGAFISSFFSEPYRSLRDQKLRQAPYRLIISYWVS